MIDKNKLYAATDGGLRILELVFPGIAEAARSNKPFKMRPDERTASARARLYNGVWKVTDFGGEGRAIDPIQAYMEQTGITRFGEAVLRLAQQFNVTDELDRSVNKPEFRKAPATADEPDGQANWDIDQEFTDAECKVMGPNVTPETLKSLHWYRCTRLSYTVKRETITKRPTAAYPIFMRECWFTGPDGKEDRFYKIYEPLNPDKGYRFSYRPAGKKPQRYTNGLKELIAAYTKYNESERANWEKDPANENRPYKEQKLPEAFICSGERDSLCVRALGYHPLWFNSETYKVTPEEIREIMRYVETLYNIPDIDDTGRLKGTELAKQYIDIHTIWLPDWLSNFRDNRGKARKDFRDWTELRPKASDFRELMDTANPAKFWTVSKDKKRKYSIDIDCLFSFLKLYGFYTLKDDNAKSARFVRIENNIVTETTPKKIRDFVITWTRQTAQKRELRNLVISTPLLSAGQLEALDEIDPDFTNYTDRSQFFFFPKFAIEATGKELKKHDLRTATLGRYVWSKNVIDHNINLLPDLFTIEHPEGCYESGDFDITINSLKSKYFDFLINSSRIYWRKELEQNLADMTEEERSAYREAHKFDIAGEGLTPEEIAEQKRCLISKIFCIGYLMHRYKSPSRGWSPFVMDNLIGENGQQCNGRSGKSFMFIALSRFLNYVKLSGRNPRLMDNPFVFEQVSKFTDLVLVDDCSEYMPIKEFYDVISSDMTINAKNVSAYTISFEEAPKFVFTTNYAPKDSDQSSTQRMLYVVFSDYYHQRTDENDYNETRQIRDDFQKDLFTKNSYTEAEWEADINFILQCVKFYLSVSQLPVKIEPNMSNIIFRRYQSDMTDNFREWAEQYFAEGGEHLDVDVVRENMLEDYKRFSGVTKVTAQSFKRSLVGFCYTCDYIDALNPEELCNSGSRILKDIEDPMTHTKKKKEVFHIRTKREAARIQNPPPAPPVQDELPF